MAGLLVCGRLDPLIVSVRVAIEIEDANEVSSSIGNLFKKLTVEMLSVE